MIDLYGIPNCSTVKKAKSWLEAQNLPFVFHNFKTTAPSLEQLKTWEEAIGLSLLLNKKGTTWRKLSEAEQAQASNLEGALQLMHQNPSLIKRPILQSQALTLCGFTESLYSENLG